MSTFENVFVTGAGTMGRGIAHVCALAGMRTILYDLDEGMLKDARETIETNLDKGVSRDKISEADKNRALSNLSTTTEFRCQNADLFVEAIPEKMALKQKIFADACQQTKPGTLLASNTSSLSITEIASATTRPEDVVGLHFFNPVHIMKLLEIVKGAHTSEENIERAVAFAKEIGKTKVVVNDAPGFATSRLGITLGNEAMRMVEEGVASPEDIDTAMKLGYGHPMGPLMLTDLVGLDVRFHISNALFDEIKSDTFKAPRILRRLVRAGAMGKKSGAGFYIWKEGKPVSVNPLAWRG